MLLSSLFHFVLLGLLTGFIYENYCDEAISRKTKVRRIKMASIVMVMMMVSTCYTILSF